MATRSIPRIAGALAILIFLPPAGRAVKVKRGASADSYLNAAPHAGEPVFGKGKGVPLLR